MKDPDQVRLQLKDDIVLAECPEPTLWWLGHCGFVVKWHSAIFLIDPYLSNSQEHRYRRSDHPHQRLYSPPPLDPATFAWAGLVLVTHAHQAHLDPETTPLLLNKSESAKLVLPRSAAGRAHMMGIDYLRMITMDGGQHMEYETREGDVIRIDAIPSAHEHLDWTEDTGYPYLGYILRMGDHTIYHAGDCAPYAGLAGTLRPYDLDLAILPINGRDPSRGMPGNFTIAEAAELAEQAAVKCLAPMHYGMFAVNNVDVDSFVTHMLGHRPSVRFKVFEIGERWMLPAKELI